MLIATDLVRDETIALLDRLSPQRREPWVLDDGIEARLWRDMAPWTEVGLDTGTGSFGPQATELVRVLLQHGGSGTAPYRSRETEGRRWTLPVFEQAVLRGRPLDLLTAAGLDEFVAAVPSGEVLGWGVVANAVRERLFGPDMEVRRGLRHFSAGTKLWVSRPWNGDGGENLWVVGPHRGSRKPIRIIIPSAHLEYARPKGVYSPSLLRRLESVGYRMLNETLGASKTWAASLAEPTIDAVLEHTRRWALVSDPPPMELEVDGTTLYLAHFNHRKARYSPLPPPIEP